MAAASEDPDDMVEFECDNWEELVDSKLLELGFGLECDKAFSFLTSQVKQEEKKQEEIKKIFAEAEAELKKFKEALEREQGIDGNKGAESGESDDDVQFIQTTYDPQLAAKQKQKLQQQMTRAPVMRVQTGQKVVVGQAAQRTTTGAPNSMVSILQRPALNVDQTVAASQGKVPMTTTAPTDVIPLTSQPAPKPVVAVAVKQIELVVGMKLYGKKFNDMWYKGTLVDIHNKERPINERKYKIKYDGKGMKVLNGKHIAFAEHPANTLPVGSRVVALYKDEDGTPTSSYYAGIVAEPPSVRNNQRYLVFFDDGYAQYCNGKEIHKVFEQSKDVWEDIHPDSQEFIKSYLKQYPERPMVRLQKGQSVKTEWNGKWWTARVQEVDASLVKMYFDADKRVEWIYRGSTRLEPLYTELANAEASKAAGRGRRHNLNVKSNKKPYVEYTRGTDYTRGIDEEAKKQQRMQAQMSAPVAMATATTPTAGLTPVTSRQVSHDSTGSAGNGTKKKSNVAKKSTMSRSPYPQHHEAATQKSDKQKATDGIEKRNQYQASSISRNRLGVDIASVLQDRLLHEETADIDEDALGERMDIDQPMSGKNITRKRFKKHRCGKQCMKDIDDDPQKFKGYNPLLIPMLNGWERQISKQKNTGKRVVCYRAPCCRRLRCMREVDQYLALTDSKLTIDLFCYDQVLHTHSEFVPVRTFCDIKDLSYGKERVPISCVNGIDRHYPDYVEYSNQRLPAKGVKLNLDPEFLVCCDCKDECRDKSKCACWQLTISATAASNGGKVDPDAGYDDRRLREPIVTGIYECNSRCKCSSRCHNRVAQNGLQLRLQVFKTESRGWGLRCLDDIPSGGFICIYAGQLLTEQGANEDGQQYGDEYLAELDYIEVVERLKEGYESDVNTEVGEGNEDEEEEEEESDDPSDQGEDDTSDSTFSGERYLKKASRAKKSAQSDERVGKLVLKRESSTGDKDKEWTVKAVKSASPQKKTADWVNSIPDDAIVISDEDEDGHPHAAATKAIKEAQNKLLKTEELPDLDAAPAATNAGNSSTLRALLGAELKKPPQVKGSTSPRLTLKIKPKEEPGEDIKPKIEGSKLDDGIGTLRITDPTSLNTDNVDSEDSDDMPLSKLPSVDKGADDEEDEEEMAYGEGGAEINFRRTTRSQTSRFSNLPDPKSKQHISPLKIKLSTLEIQSQDIKKDKKEKEVDDKKDQPSTRSYFGDNEHCYVMDAKSIGNLGRYLNHSCCPNVFVQNVFVDTHDLRFPWVAFFASVYVRAGTELTWDYNYEVGSVPGTLLGGEMEQIVQQTLDLQAHSSDQTCTKALTDSVRSLFSLATSAPKRGKSQTMPTHLLDPAPSGTRNSGKRGRRSEKGNQFSKGKNSGKSHSS